MRRIALLSLATFLFLVAGEVRAQKTEDYPLTVHVYRTGTFQIDGLLRICLEVTINEQKLTLESEFPAYAGRAGRFAMKIGDYKARILRDDRINAAQYAREYEFLLSDGKKLKFYVTGESEN
jgi:hypothetical protein